MQTRRLVAGVVAASAALLTACGSSDSSSSTATDGGSSATTDKGTVRISGQNFTEAEIVADMYAAVLEKAGYSPEVHLVDTRDVYMKIFPKKLDVVPEYTGGIIDFLIAQAKGADAPIPTTSDPAKAIDQAKSEIDDAGITLLTPSAATDANAFFVTKDYAEQNNLSDLSDLKGKSVVLAAHPDCPGRLDCEGGLSSKYGIDITKVLPLGYASPQTYKSVIDGESQLGETSTTDGTLESQGLVVLPDDKQIQPAQNLVPMVSSAFLKDHPDVADPLNELMSKLTTEDLTQLNAQVSVDRQKAEDVAQQWLSDNGLL
jgi:osmoprotectant transport system substrate-binding protein